MPCHEIVYEDKGKIKKWNRLSKKNRGPATGCTAGAGSKSAGNSPTETLQQQIDAGFLMHLEELKEFLMLEKNLTQEGLFRKTGAVSRQNELRMHIQPDQPLDLELTGFSAHDCATVFKSFLAELPEPLLTDAHYPAHLQIAPLSQALMGVRWRLPQSANNISTRCSCSFSCSPKSIASYCSTLLKCSIRWQRVRRSSSKFPES
ncbi:uncharacterized protein LOC117195149 [Drosophila miranda]|uniref:uncharacterized protein LOC117195149 n=1 Tax=Drosophila miranda TaxID=7229 RepID=UPI00143F7EEF|nr:uncharacterized protein LOC117195149 [Drosophila miranda]